MRKKKPTAGERMIAGAKSALAFAKGEPDHGCIVHYPEKGRVFLSFEDICLRNLPEGKFSHRCITAEEARALVEQARRDNRLLCVSDDDLLAPYEERSAEKNEDLCRVLTEHFDMPLSIKDFMSAMEHEGETLYSTAPLQCVQVEGEDRLLIVTCHYSMERGRKGAFPDFKIIPESVAFHLIESDAGTKSVSNA